MGTNLSGKMPRTRQIIWRPFSCSTKEHGLSKANHSRTLFRENIKSPKEFWKKIKQIYPKENNSANVKMFKLDEEPVIDKQKLAIVFAHSLPM